MIAGHSAVIIVTTADQPFTIHSSQITIHKSLFLEGCHRFEDLSTFLEAFDRKRRDVNRRGPSFHNQFCNHLSDRRTMLESVATEAVGENQSLAKIAGLVRSEIATRMRMAAFVRSVG